MPKPQRKKHPDELLQEILDFLLYIDDFERIQDLKVYLFLFSFGRRSD